MSGQSAVCRARALVGARFRPQGREPATGLDCIGLVLLAHAIQCEEVRRDYRMRRERRRGLDAQLALYFRRIGRRQQRPGDVLLCTPRSDQLHLVIDCGSSFIHADAALRRVVEAPGEPPWPVVAAWRRRKPGKS